MFIITKAVSNGDIYFNKAVQILQLCLLDLSSDKISIISDFFICFGKPQKVIFLTARPLRGGGVKGLANKKKRLF